MDNLLWVAGGRDFDELDLMEWALAPHIESGKRLITGAATGADMMAQTLWHQAQLTYIAVPAQWDKFGKSAGPIRNREIAMWEPTVCVLFPGGRGTAHTKQVVREFDIPYSEIKAGQNKRELVE